MKEAVIVSSFVAGGFVLGSIFGASLYHAAHDRAYRAFAYAQHQADAARHDVVNVARSLVGRNDVAKAPASQKDR